MKVMRLKLFQQTACYKKPFAFKVSETYPLPPYSTVKGMIHSIIEATSFIPMKISIQGEYNTIFTDYQTHYFYKKNKMNEFALTMDGLDVSINLNDITTMPIYMHLLYDVNLLIHIYAEDSVLNEIETKIKTGTSYLSLGRWEDLVRIDECEVVEITKCEDEPITKYNAYVPIKYLEDESYFPYTLNWKYEIINDVRIWDKISVGYVQKGVSIESFEGLFIDNYGDVIFFP